MKKIFILLAAMLVCFTVPAQTPEFMKLYNAALGTFNARNSRAKEHPANGKDDIVISEFSGRMLRNIMPEKGEIGSHMVNRIDIIRQIKFPETESCELFDKLHAMAESDIYERLSITNIGGESIYIYTAPYKHSGSEFLVFVVKGRKRVACDIVGEITLRDIVDLIYGRA